jgi:Ca2+-binding RTX toxin-like protein
VSVRGSQLGNNRAEYGAGILNDGTLTLSDSVISQNEAVGGDGGAIYNIDTADILDSTLTDNKAGSGGGIANRFKLKLVNSTLQGNSALFGGGISNSSILQVANSTLADNSATLFDGGGLSNYANAVATVTNSTFSGNTAGNDGGGVHQSSSSLLTVNSSTIVDNAADNDTSNGGRGGGIYVGGAGVSIGNSIVAGNLNPAGPAASPDCFGPLTSTGYNIIGDLDNCYVTLLDSDGTGVPQFGPLANNGGPTPTHALLGRLGAIDNGPSGAACTGTDQRGVPRQSPCDTGAYELVRCGNLPVTVVGTPSSEDINGTAKADGILALGGEDRVRSGGGNDRICGGSGSDELTGGQGNDYLDGGSGRDRCSGGAGKDTYRSCETKR